MKRIEIEDKLNRIIGRYCDISVMEPNKNVFGDPLYLSPRDMAAIFLDVEKAFGTKINELVMLMPEFTYSYLVCAIETKVP